MNARQVLAEAKNLARKLQYHVREDYLDGAGGGHCFFSGKKVLLLDVTQSAEEQLRDVVDALRAESRLWDHEMSPELSDQLQLSSAA
ncbi:MAG: hypothetical protein AAF961_02470 [Planctomycetota bacterium]